MTTVPLRHFCAALAATIAAVAPSATSIAQSATTQVAADPYTAIYDAISTQQNEAAFIEAVIGEMTRQLIAASPEIATAEAAEPGFARGLANATLPALSQYSSRVKGQFKPRFVALFRERLTVAEAKDIAEFYSSEIGRKLMSNVVGNMTMSATMSEAVKEADEDGTVSRQAVESDISSATNTALSRLTPTDLEALGRLALEKPALRKLNDLREPIMALRTEMENAPMTAEENQAMDTSLAAAIKKFGASD